MQWSVGAIADTVSGTVTQGDPATVVASATNDSRAIGTDALFVALVAERDGHDFVAAAAAGGAVAALSARPVAELGELPPDLAVIEVADTAAALSSLGSAGRARLDGRVVVGITGSVGKTSTKDLLAAVLAQDRPTHASERSFNNELGVPLTILNAPDDTRALVLEMGARGVGHIARLCAVGRPTVGIVTVVGAAHTSEFGSLEAVGRAKGELVAALPSADEGGVAVLNAVNPHVVAMADRTDARVVWFVPATAPPGAVSAGDHAGPIVWADDVVVDDDLVPRATIRSDWGSFPVVLGARGVHLLDNAVAAAAAALAVGVGPEAIAAGLAAPVLSPMRMALTRAAGGTAVLDDTYNANPMSVAAALHSLAALPARRRVAVLGVMAELGDEGPAEHARMGRLAADLGIEVIAVAAPDYLAGVDPDGPVPAALAADVHEAHRLLTDPPHGPAIGPDDAVLAKGSRVAGLERLVAQLVEPT